MKKYYPLLCSILLYTFFLVYLFLLLSVLLFERINFNGEQYLVRSINIVPFHTIGTYLSEIIHKSSRIAFTNIFWNVLMFAPLGLYIPVIKGGKKTITYLYWIFLFSLTAEILQWIFGLGASDIDDIILNCLGGFLGLMAFKILLIIFKKENKVRIFTAIIAALVGFPIVYISIATYLYNQ